MKSKLFIAALTIGMLAGTTLSADARSHRHHKHHSSMGTKSMNANPAASKGDATGQGTVGPGTNNNNSPSGAKK